MKVTLTNGKPTSFDMNADEVRIILSNHINKVLQQRFDQPTKVAMGSAYFSCGYGFAGEITINPDVPTITEVEL
jgi:hypothetical protein